jgi:hypothetical protein
MQGRAQVGIAAATELQALCAWTTATTLATKIDVNNFIVGDYLAFVFGSTNVLFSFGTDP